MCDALQHALSLLLLYEEAQKEGLRLVPQEVASKVGVEESSEDSGDTDAALQAATAAWEGTGYVSYMEHQRTKGWKD